MENEKYSNYPLSISAILGLIEANDIAIPEIQRPFVWKKTQVRDLIDSLYKGYPTGYIILWKNPNVKLKDGTISSGKKVLIDGQQRITALMTAVAGRTVFNSDYWKGQCGPGVHYPVLVDYNGGDAQNPELSVQIIPQEQFPAR